MSAAPKQKISLTPTRKQLKKGELLFSEGESSRSMFVIKAGMIRIFKKKGNAQIEIDTIRTGQIVGELAFLDGNPRSASGEALTDTELVEISGQVFTNTLSKMPDWLKLLLKTVVGRLRSASTRIRQLEQASAGLNYSGKKNQPPGYVYLPIMDILKAGTALLLVGARNGVQNESGTGVQIRIGLLQRYGFQIMGVPVAKITSILDVFAQAKIVEIDEITAGVTLVDPDFLEELLAYLNEEKMLEDEKQHHLTVRGFYIMGMIMKYLDEFPPDETGTATVNLAAIIKWEEEAHGKIPFKLDESHALIELGYISQINLKSSEECLTTLKTLEFKKAFRLQRVVKLIDAANQAKDPNRS